MKPKDITIGTNYNCTVGRNVVEVVIKSGSPDNGWKVRTVDTGKTLAVRDAARLTRIPTMPAKTAKTTSKRATRQPRAKSTASGTHSLLDAAAIVLQSHPRLKCFQIVDLAIEQGLWSTKGKTPANTLAACIGREIKEKGDQSRFRKVSRGIFALAE